MITLVLGGTRSGKSAVAERLAGNLRAPLCYVATMVLGDDPELAERVAAHRARRPPEWQTIEAGADLAQVIAEHHGSLLIDSLGPWVAAHPAPAEASQELVAALANRQSDVVIVSEEVGLGVHPSSEIGRQFRDDLGAVNQAVADIADEVLLVVAGRVLPLGARSDA